MSPRNRVSLSVATIAMMLAFSSGPSFAQDFSLEDTFSVFETGDDGVVVEWFCRSTPHATDDAADVVACWDDPAAFENHQTPLVQKVIRRDGRKLGKVAIWSAAMSGDREPIAPDVVRTRTLRDVSPAELTTGDIFAEFARADVVYVPWGVTSDECDDAVSCAQHIKETCALLGGDVEEVHFVRGAAIPCSGRCSTGNLVQAICANGPGTDLDLRWW